MLSFTGLGIYARAKECADGIDYTCAGGVCSPCGPEQERVFMALQDAANRLVIAFGMDASPAVSANGTCSGGYLLALTGRIDACTRRTVRDLIQGPAPEFLPQTPAAAEFAAQPYIKKTARLAVELLEYLDLVGALVEAPAPPPEIAPEPEPLPAPEVEIPPEPLPPAPPPAPERELAPEPAPLRPPPPPAPAPAPRPGLEPAPAPPPPRAPIEPEPTAPAPPPAPPKSRAHIYAGLAVGALAVISVGIWARRRAR
jgi:hypothetical protein